MIFFNNKKLLQINNKAYIIKNVKNIGICEANTLTRDTIFDGPGSVPTLTELKILICYIINSLGGKIPETHLTQTLHYENIANFFDSEGALSELIKNGCIVEKDGLLSVSQKGEQVAVELKSSVRSGVRERALSTVTKMLADIKKQRLADVKIVPQQKGCKVVCRVADGDNELMNFDITVPNTECAEFIKERMLEDPSYLYSGMVDLLLNRSAFEENSKK